MHGATPALPYLREAMLFLIAAGIIVPLLHRWRVSPVLGYLLVGYLIGPYGLGLFAGQWPWLAYLSIPEISGVRALAELGVVFLLFVIGLELSLGRLWALRRLVFGLGSLQVLVSALAIAAVAGLLGSSATAATLIGASLALSSTAIVMQLLAERRQLGTPLGRAAFSILLLQDLAVVPILFLVGVLGAQQGGGVLLPLLLALGKALLVMAAIFVVGRMLLRPLMRLVARARSPEMFMAAILLIAIGSASLTAIAGLSMALGAFLAGLLLAETEFRHEIEVDIEPFKGLLLGLFFVSVGMGVDARLVASNLGAILATLLALVAAKALIIYLLARAFGLSRALALETGLLLGQAGEFAFVVLGLASQMTLLPSSDIQFLLIVVSLSMLLTPGLVALARRSVAGMIRREPEHAQPEPMALDGIEGHVVIAGFGRVGQALARVLDSERLSYVALDLDAEHVARARAESLPVFYGDASRLDMLRRAHLATARALVVTMDSAQAAEHIVRAVRQFAPELPIYARARDRAHGRRLLQQGATEVTPETIEASLQLAARVLVSTGFSEDAAKQRIQIEREAELRRLRESLP
ncbi:MAG: monovalent cation:proton antiporter-2 (CPA2) family protein [Xanthomonadales bacterium]|nr:monovalent cation:proton antiporter-2 (CPA2) family protein [Xanthomonadales bacterium]MCP5475416.1 cation:proton antiporter [Rhodanobacteraceae bacterium]